MRQYPVMSLYYHIWLELVGFKVYYLAKASQYFLSTAPLVDQERLIVLSYFHFNEMCLIIFLLLLVDYH